MCSQILIFTCSIPHTASKVFDHYDMTIIGIFVLLEGYSDCTAFQWWFQRTTMNNCGYQAQTASALGFGLLDQNVLFDKISQFKLRSHLCTRWQLPRIFRAPPHKLLYFGGKYGHESILRCRYQSTSQWEMNEMRQKPQWSSKRSPNNARHRALICYGTHV
jgi:hypothetical protein